MKSRRALLASGLLLLLAGCRPQAWRDYHFTDPLEFYFSYPTTTDLGGAPPLFIALLGEGRSPLDCIELFQQFAEDRFYALLCPDLGGAGARWGVAGKGRPGAAPDDQRRRRRAESGLCPAGVRSDRSVRQLTPETALRILAETRIAPALPDGAFA